VKNITNQVDMTCPSSASGKEQVTQHLWKNKSVCNS